MAVQSIFTIPAQPTTGALDYIPLGGDGLTAPRGAYSIVGHAVTGSVSGGAMSVRVSMDPRYCALVAWVTAQNTQVSSADADLRIVLGDADGRVPAIVQQGPVVATSATVNAVTVARTFVPNPIVLPGGGVVPFINVAMLNVDADVLKMDAMIYIFDIRVRELTPMGPLLWARGAL